MKRYSQALIKDIRITASLKGGFLFVLGLSDTIIKVVSDTNYIINMV